jgi:hypothetical protein
VKLWKVSIIVNFSTIFLHQCFCSNDCLLGNFLRAVRQNRKNFSRNHEESKIQPRREILAFHNGKIVARPPSASLAQCIIQLRPQKSSEHLKLVSTKLREIVCCSICKDNFSIANKGRSDINQHLGSQKHSKAIRAASGSVKINNFLIPKFTKLEEQVSAVEGTLAYPTVKHHFSFRSRLHN